MEDRDKSLDELIQELESLRKQVAAFEAAQGNLTGIVEIADDSTDPTDTQKTLRQSERKYRILVENAPTGILVSDTRGQVLEVNRACLEILGSPGPEATKSINMLTFPPLMDAGISGAFAKCMARSELIRHDTPYVSKWGKKSHLRIILAPMFNEEGAVEGCQAVVEDITERKKAEDALRESEERLRLAQKATNDVVWDWDIVHDAQLWNEAGTTIFGWTDIVQLPQNAAWWADRVHPDDRQRVEEGFFSVVENPTSHYWQDEYRFQKADGSFAQVFDRGYVLRDAQGNAVRMIGAMLDITKRKKMETELKESHRRLEESQRIARIGTWEWNSVTGEAYWSDEVYRIFGLEAGSVTPSYELARDLTFSADTQMWEQAVEKALESAGAFQLEYLALRKDGEVIWVRNEGEVVRDMDGRTTKILGTVQDITESKNMETQLLQAQKMEAVGTLAGGIAHDFNNLLQAVLGYTEILIGRQKPGSRDVQDLRKIYAAGMRGADLVRNLLTFSRKVEPKMRVMDLSQEVMEIHKLLSRTISKTIKIVLRSRGYVYEILGDPSQVGQILMNLAVNARDAMPDGGELTIETESVLLDEGFCKSHPEVKPGPYVLLSVSDTGHGMDKHTVERIFDPFFSTKDVGKGTGLGLATVYGIVKEHRGYIGCSSEPGQGTVFRIYFPAMEREKDVQTREEEIEPPGGTETILLVEDEKPLRDLGKYVLTTFGYQVLEAADGQDALKIYRNQGKVISLVVLDLNMPEMDGEQCLAEILSLNPKARVLVVTGFLEHVSKGSLAERSAAGLVSKPYEVKQLLKKVRDILDAD